MFRILFILNVFNYVFVEFKKPFEVFRACLINLTADAIWSKNENYLFKGVNFIFNIFKVLRIIMATELFNINAF